MQKIKSLTLFDLCLCVLIIYFIAAPNKLPTILILGKKLFI